MPKSKRLRETVVVKEGHTKSYTGKGKARSKLKGKVDRSGNEAFLEKVRNAVDQYQRLFILKLHNSRSQKLAELRMEMRDSKMMFGKNKLMLVAFGRTESEEYADGLHKAVKFLKGQRALLFTNRSEEDTLTTLSQFKDIQFARSGSLATQRVVVAAGPMQRFSHSMEPQLRNLGMPVKLDRGIIHLEQDFEVCKQGEVLNPEQCRILEHLDVQLSEFKISNIAMWDKDGGWTEYSEDEKSANLGLLNGDEVRLQCKELDDGRYYFVSW